MKNTLRNLTLTAAFATSCGTISTAATTDLAFIMDRSNSISEANFESAMESLADALAASIPFDEPDNRYRITVIKFNDVSTGADVVVSNVLVDSEAVRDTVVQQIRDETNATSSTTCYSCAFDQLTATVTSFSDNSIINMMTDGAPNVGLLGSDLLLQRDDLKTAGWDSLSFEAINLGTAGETLLSDLAFDTAGTGPQAIITDPNDITDPLNASFVLRVDNFGDAYAAAISSKVQRVVDPDPSPVPVPAALPLLLAGLGMFGAIRLRKSKRAAA